MDIVAHSVQGGLDQPLPMRKAQKDLMVRVDEVFDRAIKEGDPEIAATAIESLSNVSRIAGLAVAKFFYLVIQNWDNFDINQTPEEWIFERLGYQEITVKRYLRVHVMLTSGEIPKEDLELLECRPIRELINLGSLVAQGFEITKEDWHKLAMAPDKSTVDKICAKIKGAPPKKNALTGEIDVKGNIYAWENGRKEFVGHLVMEPQVGPVAKLRERIITGGRLLEKE